MRIIDYGGSLYIAESEGDGGRGVRGLVIMVEPWGEDREEYEPIMEEEEN